MWMLGQPFDVIGHGYPEPEPGATLLVVDAREQTWEGHAYRRLPSAFLGPRQVEYSWLVPDTAPSTAPSRRRSWRPSWSRRRGSDGPGPVGQLLRGHRLDAGPGGRPRLGRRGRGLGAARGSEAAARALDSKYSHDPWFKGVRHLNHGEADPDWLVRPAVLEGLGVLRRASSSSRWSRCTPCTWACADTRSALDRT